MPQGIKERKNVLMFISSIKTLCTPGWQCSLHEAYMTSVLSGKYGNMAGAEKDQNDSSPQRGTCYLAALSKGMLSPGWKGSSRAFSANVGTCHIFCCNDGSDPELSANLDTGQLVSQPGCGIVFSPTAVAKHWCCKPGKVDLRMWFMDSWEIGYLVSNSLMVVLEKTSSMSQRDVVSNWCFWLSIDSTNNFVKCL